MQGALQHFLEYRERMDHKETSSFFSSISFSDILSEWDDLTDDQALQVFIALPIELKRDLLPSLSDHDQEHIILGLSSQNKKDLFRLLEPDDLVDIMRTVNKDVRDSVWEDLSDEGKREMLFLLRFDEDDAAGWMTPRFLAVQGGITVHQAIQFIRANCNTVEFLFNIYIIDQLERLIGMVSMKTLLAAKDETVISDLITEKVVFVYEDTDQEEVATTIDDNDMVSIPVVNHDHVLIGIITFDDIIDVIREEQTEDMYKMGAMSGTSDEYSEMSMWDLVKKRAPWLIILLLLGTVSANVLHHYESILSATAVLIIFMPVITQTGGNVGSQASTLMIRGLATGDIQFKAIRKILLRESLIGLAIGIITGLVVTARSVLLPPGVTPFVGFVIGSALLFVVWISNIIGIIAPLIIHKLGKDPTVMSAPLMATLIDICGYAIYFETAKVFLQI